MASGSGRSASREPLVRRARVLLVLLVALQACDDPGPVRPELLELEAREALWDSAGPPSYEYAVERLCFCPPEYIGPVRVRVEDGVVVEREYVESGLAVPDDVAPGFPSVDGLFDLLRSAYEAAAHEITVTYDPALGVPLDFWIDYMEMAADEELGMRVTEAVAPLP